MIEEVSADRILMGNIETGEDLLDSLHGICKKEKIRLGRIEALGAVQKAYIGFYDQTASEYRFQLLDQPLEITMFLGNISLKDDIPFVHAHITLADEKGNCFGGHLAKGTVVFACEYVIHVFRGPNLERVPHPSTGLSLWK
jgi:predicted DNA-binding protein with PD1-like motif